jgi:NADH-quinone oxidoreductase subunit L
MDWSSCFPIAAVFLPLASAIIAGFFGRALGDRVTGAVTSLLVLIAAVNSVILFHDVALLGKVKHIVLAEWIHSGAFQVDWALKLDTLTVIMLVVVNGVSAMVHIYATGYMSHDKSVPRFMAYLSFFTFCMLMLVTSDNLVQMFFGWEGVGVASYLLINFWYEKESANRAAMKAFLVNRVGDLGFALGIMLCFALFGGVRFEEIFQQAPALAESGRSFAIGGFSLSAVDAACLLLFIGAMGKSAQLGLHTWLPDAMEGPTPVSALIHAATMVTAGVFMVARLSPLFEYAPFARDIICLLGAATALFAATIGLTQFDIKRVIAYSTMSQLGYMFFALGVSAYSAAIFHLMTHAFFKALLFLGAGSVIHAMSGEQDLRKMGGLWRKIPFTYALMWVGSLALAGIGIYGIFGMAGFYSKDIILEAAWASSSRYGKLAYGIGVLTAFLTAFYSWRLLIMAFHGKSRASKEVQDHVHESPAVMLLPLLPLAVGAFVAGSGAYEWFVGEGRELFWGEALRVLPSQDSVEAAHHVPKWVKLTPVIAAASGIGVAYVFYLLMPFLPALLARASGGIYRLIYNKYYIDELYQAIFVRNAPRLGLVLWRGGDDNIIDRFGPNGVAALAQRVARMMSSLQTGFVYHYALVIVTGLTLFLTWYWFR